MSTVHVVVMGVSGCGKSTVARGLADRLDLRFAEADEFHPPGNVDKMAAGVPLDDADRLPWLAALAGWMREQAAAGQSTVMACSALTRAYRDVLRDGPPRVLFVHLDGPAEVVAERLAARTGHFMPASLLASQVATLEPLGPGEEGVVLDLRQDPNALVGAAAQWLAARR
jgi:gluconokinase